MIKLADLINIPKGLNAGVAPAGNRVMLAALGNPRSNYSAVCQPVTNPTLKKRIKTADVGPFRVTGLDSAIASLQRIMVRIEEEEPDVLAALGTAGMLCCRLIRGSQTSISNHSWGTAIDLTINGQLVPMGRPKAQRGLLAAYPFFHEEGWFWGAGFGRPDSMHFEAGRELVLKWADEKVPVKVLGPIGDLEMGDRGPEVVVIQKALNALGEKLTTDGVFGANTRRAVVAFQAKNKLRADGIVGKDTRTLLEN